MTTQTDTPPTNGKFSPVTHEPARNIPIELIRESKMNPRKSFDEVKLGELAASIHAHGIQQDLLVRPIVPAEKGAAFEVVYGARRFRAGKLAKLEEVPCKVRELSDEQALELMIVENSQRDDVHPLEEAEGYETLHVKFKHTVEEIAAKVGKSTGYVYNRLKLTALCPEGRESYQAGKLTSYTAMLIARIPDAGLQKKAIRAIDGSDSHFVDQREPLSARQAAEVIRSNFMLALDGAPFDKKSITLYAAAGACTTCPKRTGNQAELFSDVKSKDVCTDPMCYAVKLKAHNNEKLSELAKQGAKILDAKATKWIYPSSHAHSDYVPESTGYVRLDEKNYDDNKERTFRQLIKGQPVQIVACVGPKGAIVELVTKGAMAKAMKDAGVVKSKHQATGAASASSYQAKANEMRKRKAHKVAVTQAAIKKIGELATSKPRGDKAMWLLLAKAFGENIGFDSLTYMAKRHGRTDPRRETHGLEKKDAAELQGFVLELAASVGAWYGEGIGSHVKEAASLYHVDLTKIAGELKAAKKAKPKAPKSAKKGKAS